MAIESRALLVFKKAKPASVQVPNVHNYNKNCVYTASLFVISAPMWAFSRTLDGVVRRWTRYVITPCAAGLLILSIPVSIVRNLNFPWTSFRLAPSFALARGYALYSMPDHPPWVMVGYGPFYPIAYLPCILAKDPVTAVSGATILAYAYILVPVGLLSALVCRRLDRSLKGQGPRASWSPIFLFFGLLTSFVPSLSYITTEVHVDAPALGFFLMACYGVLRAAQAGRRGSGPSIALAGVSAGLSASCKFTLLAGVFALFLFILWSLDWKRAAVFALCTVLTGGIVYGWIIARDGFSAVLLNFQVLGNFPWVKYVPMDAGTRVTDKIVTALILGREYLVSYGAVIVGTLVLASLLTRQSADQETPPARLTVWFFLFVALMFMPVSIASFAKMGGDVNSKGLFTLPLTLAAIFALWASFHRASLSGNLIACAVLTGTIFISALSIVGDVVYLHFGRSLMEESYATVRAYPSKCYFPYDPLAHLLAGDRFRPNMDVIYSYAMGGSPVNKAAFESWGSSELGRLLPAYSVPFNELHHEHQVALGK
jgi:hypothetical protein